MAPLGAQAADLVVWWEKVFYAQEDEAVAEIIAGIERDTGKRVDRIHPVATAGGKVTARAQAAGLTSLDPAMARVVNQRRAVRRCHVGPCA
jgi:hypothetical protein